MPPKSGKTRLSHLDKRAEYLGSSSLMLETDLPTLRACLRYGMYLKEQAAIEDKELDVTEMAKEIYRVVSSFYYKADPKLSPLVIMDDKSGVIKIKRCWEDINKIIWKQKNSSSIKKRVDPQLDMLFDLIHCKCELKCFERVDCSVDKCSHKKIGSCVEEVSCAVAGCSHLIDITCFCPVDMKIPKLDLPFVRAQRMKQGER